MFLPLILISHETLGVPTAYLTVFYDAEVGIESYSSILTNKDRKRVTFCYIPSATEPLGTGLQAGPLRPTAVTPIMA